MRIRPKADSDEPACLALLREVHRSDGYPRYLPDDAVESTVVVCEAVTT